MPAQYTVVISYEEGVVNSGLLTIEDDHEDNMAVMDYALRVLSWREYSEKFLISLVKPNGKLHAAYNLILGLSGIHLDWIEEEDVFTGEYAKSSPYEETKSTVDIDTMVKGIKERMEGMVSQEDDEEDDK